MTSALPRRLRFLLVPLLLSIAISGLRAEGGDPVEAPRDSTPPPITDPAQIHRHLQEVLSQPEFHETEDGTINTRFEDWLSQWFNRLGKGIGDFKYSSSMPAFESLLMTLLVILSIAVIVYIMVRLTRRRGGMEPEPSTGTTGLKVFRPPEFYDKEIAQAISTGDWHAAWLASWRQFLSRLEHRNLVDADRTRTNREYLAQLRGKPLPASALVLLNALVDSYDRFIYGRKSILEPDWNSFHQQIDEAALLLHLSDAKASARSNGAAT
jgi:hypothetical protein